MTVSRGAMAALAAVLLVLMVLGHVGTSTQPAAPAASVHASALPIVFGPETPASGALLGLRDPVTYILVTYLDPNPAVILGVDFHLDGMNLTSAGSFNRSAFLMPVGFAFRDGPHFANFTVVDSVGAVGWHNWTFTVDTILPIVVLTSPTYPLVAASSVRVGGTALAALPQAAPVTVTVTDLQSQTSRSTVANAVTGSFSLAVPLVEGANALLLTATDAAKNAATLVMGVVSDTIPPVVTLAYPPDGLETNGSTALLRGTVNDPNATVLVDSQVVRPDAAGQWTTTVGLVPGENVITISAVDAAGNRATPILLHVDYVSPVPGLQNGTAANARSLDEQSAILRFSIVGLVLLFTGLTLALYSRMSRKLRDDRRVIAELVRASQHKR